MGRRGAGHRVPPGVAPLVHAYLNGAIGDRPIRDAATVVVLRDASDGPEVFVQRRAASMAFGAGQYVFPGGLIDPSDATTDLPWSGPEPEQWAERWSCSPAEAQALVVAAVRETFEECGILLAGPSEDTVVPDVATLDWTADRRALVSHAESFSSLLTRRALVLRSDLLRPLARWITPEWAPRRYDTRFFVTELPEGQTPQPALGESDDNLWEGLGTALARYANDTMPMMLPTVEVLHETAGPASVAGILTAQRTLAPHRFVLVEDEDGVRVDIRDSQGDTFAYRVPPE